MIKPVIRCELIVGNAVKSIYFQNSNSILMDLDNYNPEKLNLKKNYFDVIIGSPPCQTFSSIGQGKIKSLNGNIKKDIRNYLYFSFIKSSFTPTISWNVDSSISI